VDENVSVVLFSTHHHIEDTIQVNVLDPNQ
jgi:hypothetical protein